MRSRRSGHLVSDKQFPDKVGRGEDRGERASCRFTASQWELGGNDDPAALAKAWIEPLRDLFATSSHPDIVAFRLAHEGQTIGAPNQTEPVFR